MLIPDKEHTNIFQLDFPTYYWGEYLLPGWYFYDEGYHVYGPSATRDACVADMKSYFFQLDGG